MKKQKLTLRHKLMLICALGFLLSGGMLLRDLSRSARERAANERLAQRVEQMSPAIYSSSEETAQFPEQEEPQRNYRPLVEENQHLAAWLTIEGTGVDYPVMYTPEEPEYYLRRAFDGSYAVSGSLFIGADCDPDGSNVLIYGHEMKDESMFGGLDHYAQEEYARTHPEIYYDRIWEDGSYERRTFLVMAAFYSRVYQAEEENVFRYYYGTDLSEEVAFENYVAQAEAASIYDLGVTANYGDRLLTLSTCSNHTQDGRFVVVARESTPHAEKVPAAMATPHNGAQFGVQIEQNLFGAAAGEIRLRCYSGICSAK